MIDRIKIKAIETMGKIGAVRKNRYLKADANYKYNLENWDDLFREHDQKNVADINVQRINNAYHAAISENFNRDLYYISNEWVPVYSKNMAVLISALNANSTSNLKRLLRNFFREKFANGLVGLPINMQRIINNPSKLSKTWYLLDAIYRMQLLTKIFPNLDLSSLDLGKGGNPYGINYNGVFVRANADYQFYIARRLQDILNKQNKGHTILEIGGGFGGTASYIHSLGKLNKMYIDLDLPETLVLATYYLMSLFPDAKFNLYGETFDPNADFTLYPAFMIENLPIKDIDLAFNTYSFGEMSSEAAQNYVDQIERVQIPKFFHINHTRNSKTSSDDLLFKEYKLSYKSKSLWNLGRSTTADEYEFLYEFAEKR